MLVVACDVSISVMYSVVSVKWYNETVKVSFFTVTLFEVGVG